MIQITGRYVFRVAKYQISLLTILLDLFLRTNERLTMYLLLHPNNSVHTKDILRVWDELCERTRSLSRESLTCL
jgi:hypothetical protein